MNRVYIFFSEHISTIMIKMDILLKSLELAAPLLLLTALGYFLKRIGMLDEQSSQKLSRLVLDVILPVNIFVSIYDSDFKTAFDLKLVAFIIISNIVLCVFSVILSKLVTKNKQQLSALMQVCVRGNYSIFGLPLIVSIYGQKAAAPMAIAIALLTPIYNIYSIGLFEHYQDRRISIRKQIINVLTTPISVATLLAIGFNLANIVLPSFLYETLSYIAKSVTAISLINLGSSFNFKTNRSLIRLISIALIFKLILVPMLSISFAIALGFKEVALLVILVTSIVPVATSAFSTAVCYKTDIELTSSAVVYSYVFCAITIPVFISIVTMLGLI